MWIIHNTTCILQCFCWFSGFCIAIFYHHHHHHHYYSLFIIHYLYNDNIIFTIHVHVGDSLKSVEPAKAGKWKKYLDLKAAFYQSYVSQVLLLIKCS